MEAIGTMAGGVAHDFNNLTGIILGNAELALDDIPEISPATAYMSEIKHASMRAKEIVQQLLSFTRKTEKDKTVFALQSIVQETLGLIRATTPSYIEIRADINEDTGPIEADPTQMHQVILNLVTNSIHSIKQGGVIGIEISGVDINERNRTNGLKPGRYVRLAIIDSGEGIPDQNLDKIFDPYFTTKDVGKGTGMGLSVVHGIVKNHDGAITIDSTIGQGTCVTIFLPEFQGEYNQLKFENKKHEISERNELVLLVDDEPALTLLMKKMLAKFGYGVQDYIDSKEAYQTFASNPQGFNMIITDMTMPGMSGLQFVEKIREIHKDIPIIMCTGYSDLVDSKTAVSSGINAYLEKPVTKAKLAEVIQEVLTGR